MNQLFFDHLFYRWLVTTGKLDEAVNGIVPTRTIAAEFARFIAWPAGTGGCVDEILALFPGPPEVLGDMKVGTLSVRLQARYRTQLAVYCEREGRR